MAALLPVVLAVTAATRVLTLEEAVQTARAYQPQLRATANLIFRPGTSATSAANAPGSSSTAGDRGRELEGGFHPGADRARSGQELEIVAGLTGGENVIAAPVANIAEGTPVKVNRRGPPPLSQAMTL